MPEEPTPAPKPKQHRTLAEMRQDPKWLAHLASKPVLTRLDSLAVLLPAAWATAVRFDSYSTTDNAIGGRVVEAALVWAAAALAVVVCFWGATRTTDTLTTSERDRAVRALDLATALFAGYNMAGWIVTSGSSHGAAALIPQTLEVVNLAILAHVLRRKRAVEKPAPNG
jgi:hypothetical protein